jgi:hypothetical protein
METDTKRILLQMFETMLEQQKLMGELKSSRDALIEVLGQHDPNFRSDYFSAENAAIVEEVGSVDGLTDRIHRLSRLVQSQC